MIRYIIRRLIGLVILMAVISVITFGVFFMIPANPAVLACGKAVTPTCIKNVEHKLGLDQPIYKQYGEYAKGIFVGRWYPDAADPNRIRCNAPCLGFSFKDEQPVWTTIQDRFPATLSIAIGSAVLWLIVGLAVGVISALRKGTVLDRASMIVALAGVSLPAFFTGLLALYLFAAILGWLPFGGYQPLVTSPNGEPTHWYWLFTHPATTAANFPGWAEHLILPWATLAFLFAALYARLTRANMLETMTEDYIRTARAKGLPEHTVVVKHGLRAALTPIITIFGIDLGTLLGGAILTEKVYNISGIGTMLVDAVSDTDLPKIVGVTLLAAFFIVFANVVVDVLYAFVDPKVKYS